MAEKKVTPGKDFRYTQKPFHAGFIEITICCHQWKLVQKWQQLLVQICTAQALQLLLTAPCKSVIIHASRYFYMCTLTAGIDMH